MSLTKLKEIVFNQIPCEIFLAHEALGVYMAIAENSVLLNRSPHRHVFGIIQRQAFDVIILSLCKLFEKPSGSYPNYSIRTALEHFIALEDKDFSEHVSPKVNEYICAEIDSSFDDVQQGKTIDAALMIHTHFEELCPRTPLRKGKRLDATLDALKVLRDKRIAHHEDHNLEGFPVTDFESAFQLLCFAQTFVNIVGYGFFGFSMKSTSQPEEFKFEKSMSGSQMKKLILEANGLSKATLQ